MAKQHNSKVLIDGKKPNRLCNCRYKESCSPAGKCLAKCLLYKAGVTVTEKRNMEHQIESSRLGLTTIPDRLGTKNIQLILNFPNTCGR